MTTASRRSWLSAALIALVAPCWRRAAAAEPPRREEVINYSADLLDADPQRVITFTYDRFGRLTEVREGKA